MKQPLTDRQSRVLAFIRRTLVSTGSTPMQVEIARHFGMSPQGARRHVMALRRKGWIADVPKSWIRLAEDGS
jgi:SOS-response transcriptional repressor LexA